LILHQARGIRSNPEADGRHGRKGVAGDTSDAQAWKKKLEAGTIEGEVVDG